MVSLWQTFEERWKSCSLCPLAEKRKRVVLAKGQLPCDILFIGEAPGASEDSTGIPFYGPAGQKLDDIIEVALADWGRFEWTGEGYSRQRVWVPDGLRLAFTNLVCCIPLDDDGVKVHEPPPEAVRKCARRLQQFIFIAQPTMLILVGKEAQKWVNKMKADDDYLGIADLPTHDMVHPAAILRAKSNMKSVATRRSVVRLHDAVRGVFCADAQT